MKLGEDVTVAREIRPPDVRDAVTPILVASPPVVVLEVMLEAIEKVRLPGWLGSVLHGALGSALHEVACSDGCGSRHDREPERCAYARLFEAPARPAGVSERVAAMAPRRLWLWPPPPDDALLLEPGDELRFGIGMVGTAERDLGALLTALEHMAVSGIGRQLGRMRLVRVGSGGRVVWEGGQVRGRPVPAEPPGIPTGPLVLRTRTPLRIVRDGRIEPPRFADVVGAAARRLVAVSAFYGRGEPDVHVGEVQAAASRHRARIEAVWEPFRAERYSARQRRRHPMEGHVGAMWIDEPGPFTPLLAAAVPYGIGKGTSFGFGAVDLLPGQP